MGGKDRAPICALGRTFSLVLRSLCEPFDENHVIRSQFFVSPRNRLVGRACSGAMDGTQSRCRFSKAIRRRRVPYAAWIDAGSGVYAFDHSIDVLAHGFIAQ
jgi:hypothetical protein